MVKVIAIDVSVNVERLRVKAFSRFCFYSGKEIFFVGFDKNSVLFQSSKIY